MGNKDILLFYPHNFYELSSGTHRRVFDLLGYFRERSFKVDLLSISGFTNEWTDAELKKKDLVSSARAVPWGSSIKDKFRWAEAWVGGGLPDLATGPIKKAFKEMAGAKDYAFILISYAYWAGLLDCAAGKDAIKVIDLHDFLTLNNFQRSGKKGFKLGQMFEDEVSAIARFDYALSISEEERLVLSPFCPDTVFVDAPVSSRERFGGAKEEPEFDALFIGSANPFNKQGMKWFMEEVYPRLSKDVKVAIVGEIAGFVKKEDNITLIGHAEDLDGLYANTLLAICPLKAGTGLKVKVVEALSFGVPVVTTSWGLTGMIQKYDNGCCLSDSAEGFAEAIIRLKRDRAGYLRLKSEAEGFFRKRFSIEGWMSSLDSVFLKDRG
jgi:glycosyltransferase involved in cell wall biosynthesis